MKTLGLYIHIPFCEHKCDYCNFVSFCCTKEKKYEYIDALQSEIQKSGKDFEDYVIDTIFVGGGTPSVLPDGALRDILKCIKDNFNVRVDAEITVECNPNSLTLNKLEEYKQIGVNRLSVGLQAYNDKLLKSIGRIHTKKDFDIAIKKAKQLGFENINVDIILGLPNQKLRDIKHELRHIKKLDIPHVSAYGLIVEEGTKLCKDLANKKCKLPSEVLQVKMYDFTKKYLEKHGIYRYEVSNFAKIGFESKHNKKYWTNKEYLGLGLYSSSFVNNTRWKNTANLSRYLSKQFEREEVEMIDNSSQIEECIMLSLRTKEGIDLRDFKLRFGYDLCKKKQKEIDYLVSNKLITKMETHIFCTDLGFKLLNQVIVELVD